MEDVLSVSLHRSMFAKETVYGFKFSCRNIDLSLCAYENLSVILLLG